VAVVAKQYSDVGNKLTETGTLVGTPLYMSPEQAAGEKLDPRTDVWALSVITYECLTGAMPATGENYGQVLARLIRGDVKRLAEAALPIPADFVEAVDAGLVDRRRRPGLEGLRQALEKYRDAEIEPPPESTDIKDGHAPARAPKLPLLNTAAATGAGLITSTSLMPEQTAAPAPRAARTFIAVLAIVLPVFVVSFVAIRLGRGRATDGHASAGPAASAPAAVASLETPPPPASTSAASQVSPPPEPSAVPAPVRSARPKASSAPVVRPASSATRLQGGVGGNVPF
jgi:serine/threonine-protein kinase